MAVLTVVLQHQLLDQAHHGDDLAAAYSHTFWWALGFIALAVVPTLLLPSGAASKQPGDAEAATFETIAP